MCVMGLVKPGQNFTPEHIEQIYIRGNNDGFGMAYVEGERYEDGDKKGRLVRPGRVKIVKSMGPSYEVKKLYKEQVDLGVSFIFHLRNATAGDRVLDNCHPYQVLSIDNDDPIDLWMFHNGTMRNAWLDKAKSDSRNFAETHLRGMMRDRPSMLYEEGFRFFLAGMIGDGNKLIFIDNRERVSIINHNLGSYHSTGVWLSTKEDIKPYVQYKAPESRNFQLGAGQDTSTKSTAETVITDYTSNPAKPRITWKHPDGSKWVLSADGRSHYLPPIVKVKEAPQQTGTAGKADDVDFVKELIAKASPPKTADDYRRLKIELSTMSQHEMHAYVQEMPVEAAFMLKYGSGMWPEVLPEFTSMSVEELVVYCLESPWNSAFGLILMSREKDDIKTKEKMHEVS